jgi:hypothetical protein
MALFDEPAFIKPTHPKGDVIVFGKSPDLEIADAKSGVARFGGLWRTPSYFAAYVRSAEILIEHAAQNNTLDDIALPAFYMQRHALELLIKRLLSWIYEAAEYRSELGQASAWAPSARQTKASRRSHNLTRLLDDLRSSSKASGFPELSSELGELVQHIAEEVVLPLVEFQSSNVV